VVPLRDCSKEDFRENWQGEFTLVVEHCAGREESAEVPFELGARANQLLAEGMSVKDVSQALSRELEQRGEKRPRRELYAEVLALSKNLRQDAEEDEENEENAVESQTE
jgi:hypothetical protein